MGIGVALLLAAATPGALPAQVLVVPSATVKGRKGKRRAITVFNAPAPAMDLRRFGKTNDTSRLIAARPASPGYAIAASPSEPDDFRVSALVASDREARYTGRRIRRSGMAAGLSFRMTNDDGVLASQFGVAGPVGKALTRIALDAVTPD